ncbi:hypothetical protein SAMN02745866_03506 [Alteromonadaceae bacterium Bs31]|nr:hypothetical protein SAMN02745866_03506 [Alteromonadaceae bacterium Bs31]
MPAFPNKNKPASSQNKEVYDFYLSGKISKGYKLELASQWLAQVLKTTPTKAAELLKGSEKRIKQNLSKQDAQKFQKMFLTKGIITLCRRSKSLAPRDNSSTNNTPENPQATAVTDLPVIDPYFDGKVLHKPNKTYFFANIVLSTLSLGLAVLLYTAPILLIALALLNRLIAPFLQESFPHTLPLIFFYLLPSILLSAIIALLLRPWLQKDQADKNWLILKKSQQNSLFQFIEEICQKLNLAVPSKLAINGDLHCKSEYAFKLPNIRHSERTLSIGLPLALNLDNRQFAAILVHELALGRKPAVALLNNMSNFILRRTKAAAENKDSWQSRLSSCRLRTSNKLLKPVISLLLNILAKGSYCLKPYYSLINKINTLVNRSAVKAADEYAIALIGSSGLVHTLVHCQHIQHAFDQAKNRLFNSIGAMVLVDNLPILVQHFLSTNTEQQPGGQIQDAIDQGATQQKESYPSDRERIIHAEDLDVSGLVCRQIAAHELFENMNELCKKGTLLFYANENLSVNTADLVPSSKLMSSVKKDHVRDEINTSYFNRWFNTRSFWRVPSPSTVKNISLGERVQKLNQCVLKIRHATPDYIQLLEVYPRVFQNYVQLSAANEVLKAGYSIHSESIKLTSDQKENFVQHYESSKREFNLLKRQQDKFHELMGMRLFLALSSHPELGKRRIGALLLQTLFTLYQQSQFLDTLSIRVGFLPILSARVNEQHEADLLKKVQRVCKDIDQYSQSAINALHQHQCTFHQDSDSVGEFVLAHVKQEADFKAGSALQAAAYYHEVLFGLQEANRLINNQLAIIGRDSEKANNIAPLRISN